MAADEEITNGELARRLDRLEGRFDHFESGIDRKLADALRLIGAQIDKLNFVPMEVWTSERQAIDASIKSNREYVDAEIRTVRQEVRTVADSLKGTRATIQRTGWGIVSAIAVFGGGAIAVFHH